MHQYLSLNPITADGYIDSENHLCDRGVLENQIQALSRTF